MRISEVGILSILLQLAKCQASKCQRVYTRSNETTYCLFALVWGLSVYVTSSSSGKRVAQADSSSIYMY